MNIAESIVFPPFQLDLANEQLWREHQLVPLPPKTFAVLRYLVEHAGRLVTKDELLKAIWSDTRVSDGVVKGYIHDLREALGDNSQQPRFIETVSRRGHRFIGKVVSSQHSVVSRAEETGDGRRETGDLSPQVSRLTPHASHFVGRETELAQLHALLAKASRGDRQVVFVTGELGIGKTTLVEAFLEQAAATGHPRLARGQCIEHYGAGEAHLPLLEALGGLGRAADGEQVIAIFKQYAPSWLVQLPALIADADLPAVQRKVQGATRERMLRELADAFAALAAETPLIVFLEDLHWSDHATIDALSLLAQRREPARLLILGTYRPADVIVSDHPVKAVKRELQVRGQCTELALGFLTERAVADYLSRRFRGAAFPATMARRIHQGTDGNALFLTNIVDDLVARGVLQQTADGWTVTEAIEEIVLNKPENLRHMVERQVERLSADQQKLLEIASVVGAEFSAATVAAGADSTIAATEDQCEELVRRGQFLQVLGVRTLPNGTTAGQYGFLHALYQTVLYERSSAVRRMRLHHRIGESLEQSYGTRAGEIAAELAMHFARGQDIPRTLAYLHKAAENGIRRSAYREAMTHITEGMTLLSALPDSLERSQAELGFQIMLGAALLTTKGYGAPEVEPVFARARDLCAVFGESPQLSFVLSGLAGFYLVRGNYAASLEIAEKSARIAHQQQDADLLLEADLLLGLPLLYLGKTRDAHAHFEESIARYDPQRHNGLTFVYGQDPGVMSHAHETWALWLRGYADQALNRARAALTLAQESGFLINEAIAYHFLALTHQFRREQQAAQQAAAAEVAISTEQGFPFWHAMGRITQGGALLAQGQEQEGLALMRQGIEAHRTTGAEIGNTYWIALLAEGYGKTGQAEEGLATLTLALQTMRKNDERWWEAELYRLQGELTLQRSPQQSKTKAPPAKAPSSRAQGPDPQAEAESCFLQAIEIARRQEAKSLELRATMSLVRLRQRQARDSVTRTAQHASRDRLTEARRMLADVYGWFTEGFETADLTDAKVLLRMLES